ncbi:putative dienelactone hydrolase [Bradyrhizobium daqingense]|uniref:Putative dienelactone hydrolase n=2 Tax=Bradyrhizobium daqingense TaxID=993502 RepID=A0A562KX02_9BRAD|nr:putative dienelactone hydrolase [Bradyrhizobium daqingense]
MQRACKLGSDASAPAKMTRRRLGAMLLAVAVTTAVTAHPVQAQSAPPAYTDFDWVDPARARPVPTRLHWPADVAPGSRVPLIVFSHGLGGSRRGYSYLGRYWSAHGVASLHVQHAGSDSSLWAGNPLGVVDRLQRAAHESEALARALDMHFALDRMLSSPYGARIDRRRIVAAGHSYGANTALVAVGARVMRDGRWVEARDPRFTAAIVISAPPFYGETDLASVLGKITVPNLHVTATNDVIQIPGYHSPTTDRLAVFNAIATPRKLLTVFEGGSHSIFTDRAFTGGPALNPKVKAATAELTLAFLDLAYDGNRDALTRWNAAWQPILALAPDAAPPQISAPPSPRMAKRAAAGLVPAP